MRYMYERVLDCCSAGVLSAAGVLVCFFFGSTCLKCLRNNRLQASRGAGGSGRSPLNPPHPRRRVAWRAGIASSNPFELQKSLP